MKIALSCLIALTALLNFSCTKNVESSPISTSETRVEIPQPAPTPFEYKSIKEDEKPDSLEYAGYKIKKVLVKKTYEDNPAADIDDVVISKKGKIIRRFEGEYYPLGNDMDLELEQLLGGSKKQLVITDLSNRYDHSWIISLAPRFEILFDAADYDVLYGSLDTLDVNYDGEKEIALTTISSVYYGFSNVDQPRVRIVFKYDSKTRRYLPASHVFADFTLKQVSTKMSDAGGNSHPLFPYVLENTLTYIYAGKEAEGWKYFDENLPDSIMHYGMELKKEEAQATILRALKKEPIYKFIKSDLAKKNEIKGFFTKL